MSMTPKRRLIIERAIARAGLPPEGYEGEGVTPAPIGKVKDLRHTLTLDEAIDHALDVARNYPAEMGDDESLACVAQHHQLARWLTELRERRKLGYHPPCPSCRWRLRCVTTMQGSVSKDWHCTMYEHSEEPFPPIPGEEVEPT
jgi:hypothetical protein